MLRRLEPVRSVIRQASRLGWVPADCFAAITEATLAGLGKDGAQDFWSSRLRASFELPLMRPLAQGGVFLYGKDPGSIIRMTPKAYPLVFRECGFTDVEVEARNATLRIADIPPPLRTDGVVQCFAGHCRAALGFTGVDGVIELDARSLASSGALTLRTSWA